MRRAFSAANKIESQTEYPKLKLKLGEVARIAILEEPLAAYVHTFRMPRLDELGRPKMRTAERKDGTTYQDYVKDFTGRPLCLGDESLLEENGVDAKNCPACAESVRGNLIKTPDLRMAVHVFKYNTKPGSAELMPPFSGQLQVWGFTDTMFNKLADMAEESGPFSDHDLKIGKCTDETFQKWENILLLKNAAYKQSTADHKMVDDMFEFNKAKDLAYHCGSKWPREKMEAELDKVRERWAVVKGESAPTKPKDSEDLYSSMGNLMDKGAKPAANSDDDEDVWSTQKPKAMTMSDFDDLVLD